MKGSKFTTGANIEMPQIPQRIKAAFFYFVAH